MSRMKTRLNSREWYGVDKDCVGGYFEELGFTRVGEILALRMFDLFNMDRIDNIRAWEMIRCLYIFLNENSEMDQALEWKLADQSFPFTDWRRAHKAKSVRVADLVMAANMNERHYRDYLEVSHVLFTNQMNTVPVIISMEVWMN